MRTILPLQVCAIGGAFAALLHVLDRGEIQAFAGLGLGLDSARIPLAIALVSVLLLSVVRRDALAEFIARLLDEAPLSLTDRRRVAGYIGILCVFGFAMRLSHIHVVPFSSDEAQLVWLAGSEDLPSMWELMTRASPHPPGYFLLLHAVQGISSWQPFWMRLPSAIAGAACIWLAYLLGRELVGRPAGMAMALLFAVAPTAVDLSRLARNYTLPLVFLMLAAFLYARGLRRQSGRDLLLAALAAPISVSLHYLFLAGVAGIGLATAVLLALQKAPVREWLRLAVFHIPLALLLAVLYFTHIAVLPPFMEEIHVQIWAPHLEFSAIEFHRPYLATWRYLFPGPSGSVLAVLSLTGAIVLILRRNYRALILCAGPLVAAYALLWADRLPLNGTRHSFFLLPFLSVLAVANVPEVLRRFRPGSWAAAAATTGLLLVASVYTDSSLSWFEEYNLPTPAQLFRKPGLPHRMTSQHASYRILEQRAAPEDIVLLSTSAVFQFYTHYELSPILYPEAGQERNLRLGGVPGDSVRHLVHRGVPFYSGLNGWFATPTLIYQAVERVRTVFGLRRPQRLWFLWGGHQIDPRDRFAEECPMVHFDEDVMQATGGLLLQMDPNALRACGRALARKRK
ncbi:MAG: glycosyltransferase family 39 protein [Myxococcota bacterium]